MLELQKSKRRVRVPEPRASSEKDAEAARYRVACQTEEIGRRCAELGEECRR